MCWSLFPVRGLLQARNLYLLGNIQLKSDIEMTVHFSVKCQVLCVLAGGIERTGMISDKELVCAFVE